MMIAAKRSSQEEDLEAFLGQVGSTGGRVMLRGLVVVTLIAALLCAVPVG
jgi:hypothetical protein